MSDMEKTIQKQIVGFCNILPQHVEAWRSLLQDSSKPAQGVGNLAEQLQHVEKANITYMENFSDVRGKISSEILCAFEEEMLRLREIINKLNQTTHLLRSKLSSLEQLTIDLDWDDKGPLIRGTAYQPALSRLLQDGLEFVSFFSTAVRNINDSLKSLNIEKTDTVTQLRDSFNIDLEDRKITYLIALTQYINDDTHSS